MKTIRLFISVIFIALLSQACESKYPIKIGGNLLYLDGAMPYGVIVTDEMTVIIDEEIVAWNYDSVFVIVKQKPYYSIMDSIHRANPRANYDEQKRLYKKAKGIIIG